MGDFRGRWSETVGRPCGPGTVARSETGHNTGRQATAVETREKRRVGRSRLDRGFRGGLYHAAASMGFPGKGIDSMTRQPREQGRQSERRGKPSDLPADRRMAAGNTDRPRWHAAAVVLGLLVAVGLIYAQTGRFEFICYDDFDYISKNPQVLSGLSAENAAWAFGFDGPSQWHPLTWLSHQLDCEFWGKNPRGHHLTNAAIHAASAVLLFWSLGKLTGMFWPSAFVAMVFAVHPVNVESVAWMAQRKNLLSGMFGILTLGCYAIYARRGGWKSYLAVAASLTLGLLSKPMVVTVPCVLLLLDLWPLGRVRISEHGPGGKFVHSGGSVLPARATRPRSWTFLVLEKLPLLALCVASIACTMACRPTQNLVAWREEVVPLSYQWLQVPISYASYLRRVLWPATVSLGTVQTSYTDISGLWVPAVGTAGILAAVSWIAWRWRTRTPEVLVGWLWFLGTLVPVIGIWQTGAQQVASRYLYLPLVGLAVGLTWLVRGEWIRRGWRTAWLACPATIIIGAFAAKSHSETEYWQDSVTLFGHVLDEVGDDHVAHLSLGIELQRRGKLDDAYEHFEAAHRMAPEAPQDRHHLAAILMLLAQEDLKEQRFDQAEGRLARAEELEPELADIQETWGMLLASRGKAQNAIERFQRAIELDPKLPGAHYNLGNVLSALGRDEEAMRSYQESLALKPDHAEAHSNLAQVLERLGRKNDALRHFESAVRVSPRFVTGHNNLGMAWLNRGEPARAATHFRRALEIQPKYPLAQANLGTALWVVGETEKGRDLLDAAFLAAAEQGQATMAATIRKRLEGLEAGTSAFLSRVQPASYKQQDGAARRDDR